MNVNMKNLPVRRCSIRCKSNPEWGTFGIAEDQGLWYVLRSQRGDRILSKDEAVKFWELVEHK